MKATMNELVFNQNQIESMIESLAWSIKTSGLEFEQVVGIERGGLHISKPLANMLNLTHDSVRISCYDGSERRDEPIVEGWYDSSWNTLVVDDLIDDGRTIKLFKKYFRYKPSDAVAVLFWKRGSIEPEFYVEEKPEQWLVFPWETS